MGLYIGELDVKSAGVIEVKNCHLLMAFCWSLI